VASGRAVTARAIRPKNARGSPRSNPEKNLKTDPAYATLNAPVPP
jgi:hypothetical protein